jgi:hypothetical protein
MPTTEQLADLARQLKYSGVKDWHDQGYRGISPRTNKRLRYWNTEGESDHGLACCKRVLDANPTAEILQAPLFGTSSATLTELFCTYQGIKYKVEDFLEEFRPRIIIRSIGGSAVPGTSESYFWTPLKKKYNLIFFNSAGNEGSDDTGETLSASFPADIAWYTGAVSLINGKPVRCSYSSIGHDLDFMNFTSYLNGTSFASPHTAGESGLIIARYDDDMRDEELGKFITMICKDLGDAGFEKWNGNGIPILTNCQKYMTMSIGKTTALMDGVPTTLDAAPELKENRTFVPVRVISETLGFTLTWDKNVDNSLNVYITGNNLTIKLTTGIRTYFVNGTKYFFEVAPYIKNGRTMLPFRALAELLGFKVDWLPDEKKVMMMKVVQTR